MDGHGYNHCYQVDFRLYYGCWVWIVDGFTNDCEKEGMTKVSICLREETW